MIDALTALTLLALNQASISPTSVPAHGEQAAVVHLATAGMVHLAAESSSGTACVLVDHLRGPFAQSGNAGKVNCQLDLLLDAGDYQLRLASSGRGKGQVKLTAVPFEEVNRPLARLENHRLVPLTVHPGQQASYWLHLEHNGPVDLRITGRTVGRIELWRSGEWVEALDLTDARHHLVAGTDVHDWIGQPNLEAGDYLLVAYGADALPITSGTPLDRVEVRYGFPLAPAERTGTFTLSPLGVLALELPAGPSIAAITRFGDATDSLNLELHDEQGPVMNSTIAGHCQIAAQAPSPQCVAVTSGSSPHVAMVTGAPGTTFVMAWARHSTYAFEDGDYALDGDTLNFQVPTTGEYRVATHDLQIDPDAPPQGCVLEELDPDGKRNPRAIAFDFLPVSPTHPFAREFNYDGSSDLMAFSVEQTQAFRISTSGGHVTGCELFRFEGSGRVQVAASDPDSTSCHLQPLLGVGNYELHFYGGTQGIEKLVITKGRNDPAPTVGKTSCQFAHLPLEAKARYRLELTRRGSIGARGLVLRPFPLDLHPLPIHLEPGESTELPLPVGDNLAVTGPPAAKFTCSRGAVTASNQNGTCLLPAGAGTEALVVANQGKDPIDVVAMHPHVDEPPPPPMPFTPQLAPPPELAEGAALPFDFDRLSSHSVLFTVKDAGLYDVTTEGLLATACSIRTPITANVAHDQSGGRGRNCLVSQYLRDGRYLLTVTTVGASRGRGSIRVSHRATHAVAALRADGESFVRVGANELITQKLTVRKTGDFQLTTTALGGSLQCRLEDLHGWPVVAAPTPCSRARRLTSGAYIWMQMPLTVPSSRHTQLTRIVPERPLSGSKPHSVALNTSYNVNLSPKGEDTFRFALAADLDVHVALSNAMQGRLYAVSPDGSKKAIEVIPPDGTDAAPSAAPVDESAGDGMGDGDAAPPPTSEGEDPNDLPMRGMQGDEDGDAAPPPENEEPVVASTPVAPPPRRPQAHSGTVVHLAAGSYELVTQHSRGDVGIRYRLELGVDDLAPGVQMVVNAPARIPLHVAHDGVLRLGTTGETDVRCRIFDPSGRLLQESSDNGDDWNCSLAEPFAAGEYEVVIEAETQIPGVTTVTVSMPKAEDAGALVDGAHLKVGGTSASASVPAGSASTVQEVFLRSTSRFSCALTAADGTLLHHETNVRTCGFLLVPGPQPTRLDVWTLTRSADVTASLHVRPITDRSGSTVASGSVVKAVLPRAGRYATSTGMLCLTADRPGVLLPCGPEVSLPAGATVFAMLGATDGKLPLDEQVENLAGSKPTFLTLGPDLDLNRLASTRGIQLVSVRAALGEKAGPVCQLEGGVSSVTDRACFAASSVTESSLLSLRSATSDAIAVTREAHALPYPSSATTLALGHAELTLGNDHVGRFTAPNGAWRADLTVAPHTWAIQLDSHGAALDLCAPRDALSACSFEGTGGELVVFSPDEAHLEVLTQALDAPPAAVALTSLYERRGNEAGTEHLRIAAADTERLVDVEGTDDCQVRLDDGSHLETCHAHLPAKHAAILRITHGARAIRATLHGEKDLDAARFGPLPSAASAAPLPAATLVTLAGDRFERGLVLDHDAVVHVVSTGGVCALVQGSSVVTEAGLDGGCDFYRALHPGTYRLLVRRFADSPLAGRVDWTAFEVSELAEGVGAERWLAPGERRFFHFRTASAGQIGVGMQAAADVLTCRVLAADQTQLGDGCQEFLSLAAGDYLLSVRAPEHGAAVRFHPVVLGLTGSSMDVPEDYLRDFFARLGAQP